MGNYEYILKVDGIEKKRTTHEFRPNLVTEMIEDVLKINPSIKRMEFTVHKLKQLNKAPWVERELE